MDAIAPTHVKFAGNIRRKDLDLLTVSENNIFLEFMDAIAPTHVKFAGNMRRKDLDLLTVSENNIFLSDRSETHY